MQSLEVLLVAPVLRLVALLHLRKWVTSYQNRGETVCVVMMMGLSLLDQRDHLITR
jgi:hypothetical protein